MSAKKDAARWRYIQRKDYFSIYGDDYIAVGIQLPGKTIAQSVTGRAKTLNKAIDRALEAEKVDVPDLEKIEVLDPRIEEYRSLCAALTKRFPATKKLRFEGESTFEQDVLAEIDALKEKQNGLGSPTDRLNYVLEYLQARFPGVRTGFETGLPELAYIEALDKLFKTARKDALSDMAKYCSMDYSTDDVAGQRL